MIENVEDYLSCHDVKRLVLGQSGADVYEVDEKYVLKYIRKENFENKERFETYRKEGLFYQEMNGKMECLPDIIELQNKEDEILILIKKYQMLDRRCLKKEILARVVRALVMIHSTEIPDFLAKQRKVSDVAQETTQKTDRNVKILTSVQIQEFISNWKSVLSEHPGMFDEDLLTEIAESINAIITWQDGGEAVLIHGDFHMDNVLQDEDGNIVICDWQGVGIGNAASDLSFFISRLRSDGVNIEEENLVDLYVDAIREQTGIIVEKGRVLMYMYASSLLTAFVFWHAYLHGSSTERVANIYEEMEKSFSMLKKIIN